MKTCFEYTYFYHSVSVASLFTELFTWRRYNGIQCGLWPHSRRRL